MKEKLEIINAHRKALGYPLIPDNVSNEEIEKHLELIEEHAAYGEDPWTEFHSVEKLED